MKKYDVENIRTIAVMGHHGSGKTSFMESVLYVTGAKDKKGSVDDKNTTSDYLLEEKEHQASLSMSVIPVEYEGYKFNFLDTPGNAEFSAEITQALSVVKGAVLMIDGAKGIDIGTEALLSDLNQKNIPTIIFINKMDKENVKFEDLMKKLHEMIGNKAVPFLTPIVRNNDFKGYINIIDMVNRVIENGKLVNKPIPEDYLENVNEVREGIIEAVAMTSEELLDKHFSGEELSYEEICQGLRSGVLSGDLKPVVIGSVIADIGVRDILEMFEKFMPAPNDLKPVQGKHPKTGDVIVRKTTNEEPFSAYVFKTTIDPFIGSVNIIKVFSGSLSSGDKIFIPNTKETIKIGNVSVICGKDQTDVDTIYAGDIGAVTKIDEISTGFTLCDIKDPIIYTGPGFPSATIFVAISPKNKKDEDKISSALQKLND